MTSTDLIYKCFEICSWTPLKMVRSLPLNSALLSIRIPVLPFDCSYASSVEKKIESTYSLRIPLTIADSTYFFRIHLQLRNPEQLGIFACCGMCDSTKLPTKFTLQVFVRGTHGSFINGNHLHFGTCIKVCLWNPGAFRCKTVRLSSVQLASQ